tara:strand:- start:401 stop:1294 length:894 start_codon:yes stop_codon:yes gene_type:complete
MDFLKKYSVPEKGKMTKSIISQNIPYSNRHFDRIFKDFSKYSPFELAEIFRLLCCVESIKRGNTLKNTAYDYDFTPEGLSNALRSKMKIDVKRIRKQDFKFEKHLLISNFMVRLDKYKYQMNRDEFMFLLENLDGEGILAEMSSQNPISEIDKGFELHLAYSKIYDILEKYEGIEINKNAYENIDLQEAIVMQCILLANSQNGTNEFTVRTTELFSTIFLITFFFDVGSLKLENQIYKLFLEHGIKEIFNALKEIKTHTGETFDITLFCYSQSDKVIIQFHPVFKESIIMFKGDTDI